MPSYYLYVILVFFISLCFMAFVNAVPLVEEWKMSIVRAESLEKETIFARMEALRTQLSPHFLFNNFSILNGLIEENPKAAKEFIGKMSDVFRYILSHKNDEVVPLSDELRFIEDYNYLLMTRYQDKFNVTLNIENEDYWIPPVTLQQLVENAIKHNETSFDKPLEIRIRQENDYLLVENEKQAKRIPPDSSMGIGLKNIIQRFDLLSDKKASYTELNGTFLVKVPLISLHEGSYN